MSDPFVASFANLALTAERAFQRMFGDIQNALRKHLDLPDGYVFTPDDFKTDDDDYYHPGDPDS